jgi:uncharacterized glyoxalase superfamily protein PhnB
MAYQSISPVLPALDIIRASEFYKNILGFEVNIYTADNYVVMKKEGVGINLWKTDDEELCKNSGCYVYVTDVDSLYNELLPKGVIHPNGKLADRPWGMREFAIIDTEGNLLRIGQVINK